MATSKIEKKNLLLDGSALTIFGTVGFVHGKNWAMDVGLGIPVEVDPAFASPEIEAIINNDIRDGNGDKIHHVLVNPNTALRLYLEGKITRGDVEKAVATDEAVTFDGIKFNTAEGEKLLPVVVMETPDYGFATIDADGNVV